MQKSITIGTEQNQNFNKYLMENEVLITYLPDELLDIILENNNIEIDDLLHLASTCTRLYNYVKSREILWKDKLRNIVSSEEFDVIQSNHSGTWYEETKTYCQFRSDVLSELRKMSPKLYKTTYTSTHVMWQDVTRFFEIAQQKGTYLYLMIKFLHYVVKNCDGQAPSTFRKPFTLTDAFYARIIPRFLLQSVLVIKWVHALLLNKLNSQLVLHFFVQWMGTDNIHSEEEVEEELNKLAETVVCLLDSNHPLKLISAEERNLWVVVQIEENMFDPYSCLKILDAITKVLFKINPIVLTPDADLDSLNFIQVIKTRRSFMTTLASLYETVARRCGVKCEVIVFPEHLFLEWTENHRQGSTTPTFTINLTTGALERKRQCPFSQGASLARRRTFEPVLLLQNLLHFYELTGNWRNRYWITDNLVSLSLFLKSDQVVNHYGDIINTLAQLMHRNAPMDKKIDIKNISDNYLKYIWSIANLNIHTEKRTDNENEVAVNRHNSDVKYAVGMICQHVTYGYTCVIRGWTDPDPLHQPLNDPTYFIIASDNSERAVSQGQLRPAVRPQRHRQLEEALGREFLFFDGFAYVPNDELRARYPHDGPIRDMYKTQAHCGGA